MKKNILSYLTRVSAIFFLGFLSLYAYVWIGNPNPHSNESGIHWSHVSLGYNINIAVTKLWGGNLVFFNQSMPYTGSIISMAGDKSVNEIGWDGWGTYFRHITHTLEKEKDWWTLMISLWYPIIIFGIPPSVFIAKKICRSIRERTASS
jgi:hypothetical protein